MHPALVAWTPTELGDRLTWKGTSATDVPAGQMRWSSLLANGALPAEFILAQRVACTAPCYPDCNQNGATTVADFGCFQSRFVAGDPYADCNASGSLTVADFGCFQVQFVTGCP